MSTKTPASPHFVVVAAVDMSPHAETVLAAAIAQAKGKPNAELHVIHVVESEVDGLAQLVDAARDYLRREGEEATTASAARVTTHLGFGLPWRGIVQLATNVGADLVVVGTHGRRGLEHMVFGSQAEHVVRAAPCPVLAVRAKNISVPVAPEIEQACPDCLHVQQASAGAELWCARHAVHHPQAHLHYEYPQPFANGSMLLRPE